jgi:hypothetical protein
VSAGTSPNSSSLFEEQQPQQQQVQPISKFCDSSVCLSGCLIHEPCHDQVLESGCMVSAIESQVFVCSCGARYLHTLQPSPNDLHSILSVSVSVCLSVCLSESQWG